MASHPVGGASFSGDVSLLGDLSAQNVTASGTLTGGATTLGATGVGVVTSTASYFVLTPGVTPGTPAEGQIFAKASDHHLYYYNGSGWVQLDN